MHGVLRSLKFGQKGRRAFGGELGQSHRRDGDRYEAMNEKGRQRATSDGMEVFRCLANTHDSMSAHSSVALFALSQLCCPQQHVHLLLCCESTSPLVDSKLSLPFAGGSSPLSCPTLGGVGVVLLDAGGSPLPTTRPLLSLPRRLPLLPLLFCIRRFRSTRNSVIILVNSSIVPLCRIESSRSSIASGSSSSRAERTLCVDGAGEEHRPPS